MTYNFRNTKFVVLESPNVHMVLRSLDALLRLDPI